MPREAGCRERLPRRCALSRNNQRALSIRETYPRWVYVEEPGSERVLDLTSLAEELSLDYPGW